MKRLQSVSIGVLSIIMVGVMFASFANAQEVVSSQQDDRKELFLSLEEAINMALGDNLEIRIEQYNPQIREEEISDAEAAFDYGLTSTGAQTFNESVEQGMNPDQITSIEFGVNKRFRTGGNYGVGFSTSRAGFDASVAADDSYETGINLSVGHAILRNRGRDVNTVPIVIAQKSRDISVSELRAKVIDIVSQVKTTYWNLVFQLGDLEAKRLSLELAYDLIKINKAQVEVGTLAPIEVLQAEATAASREVEIISAEQTVRDVEDQLKRLLNISEDDPVWGFAIMPTDAPISTRQPVALDESLQLALEYREELQQLQKSIEIQELSVNASENQLLPELNVQGTFGLTGPDDNWGGSFGETLSFDTYSFGVGANFSYPLGNKAAKSTLNRNKLELDQTKLSVQNLEQLIITQVRQAVRAVESSYKLVEATKIARQLAEEQLDAEQKKFNEGLSTNFQVLSFQESLATARSRETQAITGYNQALVGLEQVTGITLQQHNIVVNE